MRKRTKPRLGWDRGGWEGNFPPEAIPPERLAELCRPFGIVDEAQLWELADGLNVATGQMRNALHNQRDAPNPDEVRAYFIELAEAGERLAELLNRIDDRSWQHLWPVMEREAMDLMIGRSRELIDMGAAREVAPSGRGLGGGHELFTWQDAKACGRMMAHYATLTLESVPIRKGGRPSNMPIRMWVDILCGRLESFGWAVTFDHHNPIGTGDLERLLLILMEELEPALVPKVRPALRRVRTELRRRPKTSGQ